MNTKRKGQCVTLCKLMYLPQMSKEGIGPLKCADVALMVATQPMPTVLALTRIACIMQGTLENCSTQKDWKHLILMQGAVIKQGESLEPWEGASPSRVQVPTSGLRKPRTYTETQQTHNTGTWTFREPVLYWLRWTVLREPRYLVPTISWARLCGYRMCYTCILYIHICIWYIYRPQ